MGSSRFKRPPGAIFGHVPDAAAKLPTTSADRSFMMATAREQANYKRLSWCRAFGQTGFCARVSAPGRTLAVPALVLRRKDESNRRVSFAPTPHDARSALIRKHARNRSNCRVGQSVSAREALSALGAAPCKASGSDAMFGCICCDMLHAYSALASLRSERAKQQLAIDAGPPPNKCCNRALTEKYIRDAPNRGPQHSITPLTARR